VSAAARTPIGDPGPPEVEPGLPPSRRFRTFDALLDVPPFRWYMLSMLANWSAMQMQNVVRGYLAYEITGSFAALGGVALANSLPRLALALSGGVIADRANRRYVMQAGQAFSTVVTAAVAVLLFTDLLTFNHLLIAAFLQGISMAFSQPARQAMIPSIVGPDRLTNAIGLNAMGMNSTRLLAPALGGILVAWVGGAWVYALMAVLFALAVIAMFRVPKEAVAPAGRGTGRRGGGRGGVTDIVEAFKYLRHQGTLTMLLAVHLFVVLLSMPYQRLLPGFVAEVLASNDHESATYLGFLLTMTGAGALIGSLVVASLPDRRRGLLLVGSIVVFAGSLLAFSASQHIWLSMGIVFILGFGLAGRQSLSQILIQTHVDDAYRGLTRRGRPRRTGRIRVRRGGPPARRARRRRVRALVPPPRLTRAI
jgi:MFS family permease